MTYREKVFHLINQTETAKQILRYFAFDFHFKNGFQGSITWKAPIFEVLTTKPDNPDYLYMHTFTRTINMYKFVSKISEQPNPMKGGDLID